MEERTGKIIRRSIYTFLKDFDYFTSTPAILLFPFSASILLLRSFYHSCSLTKLILFFQGTRISLLDLNLPHMIFILVFSLPFALSSLFISKASIIQSLNHHKQVFSLVCSSSLSLCYKPQQVLINLLNIVLVVTVNTATLLLLFEASSFFRSGLLVLSSINNPLINLAAGIVFYMGLTNTMVICNLALVVASIDHDCPAYKAIQKACLLRKGKNSMALLLALPINLGLVAIEALFRYRVVRANYDHVFGKLRMSMVLEGLLVTYLFSLLIVLETITSYLFIKNCDSKFGRDQEQAQICIQIKLVKDDTGISDGSQELELSFYEPTKLHSICT